MDDPWDVKSVRQLGQYTSCMKLNGVPLLPPVLSKECRKEMQYYKLLAKEVEKRISILQPYIDSDTDLSEDQTEAPETPKCELELKYGKENIPADMEPSFENIEAMRGCSSINKTLTSSPTHTELRSLSSKCLAVEHTSPPFSIDFSLNINETGRNTDSVKTRSPSPPIEIPERDNNCMKSMDVDIKHNDRCKKQEKEKVIEDVVNFSITVTTEKFSEQFSAKTQDVPLPLSCKSFTGSLNNIHKESDKNLPILVRQRSYTILNPSPQLMAHLERQSFNLGVDVSCISMSDSVSNISTPGKKRRSWDLESAKVKWSNMAQELKQKSLEYPNKANNSSSVKRQPKRSGSPTAPKFTHDRTRRSSSSSKPSPKSEPVQKTRRPSPIRNVPSNKTFIVDEAMTAKSNKSKSVKETTPPRTLNHKKELHEPISHAKTSNQKKEPSPLQPASPNPQISNSNNHASKVLDAKTPTTPKPQLISGSENPAAKVKELYEKIQKQQYIQMTSLVEKQKREQQLLQQVFEEQNNLLFKQLKTICPKSPEAVKEAWVDKTEEADRGPVSLSQLISPKSPEQPSPNPPPTVLTDSTVNNYLKHCDNVLKSSRDISSGIKKFGRSNSQNGTVHMPQTQHDDCRSRTSSPTHKITPTSRRLNYDTSASTDRDNEPMLTDRTNDTMADLNITFSSDTEECRSYPRHYKTGPPACQEATSASPVTPRNSSRSTDSAIKTMEQTIQNSIDSMCARRCKTVVKQPPTPKMQAAATRIVAHVKGYLVRRLMKTARVQGTVQTIKDALLCALQLHQDREGIRGADVDLHRRLIQQITAACYCLHDTFVASTAAERCAMIAADRDRDRDRSRRSSLATRASSKYRHSDVMSQSHSGAFPARPKRYSGSPASIMTQSNYETYSNDKAGRARYMPSPRRRPWR